MLSKRTDEWEEIIRTIEDQLTVKRNWNLHLNKPNPNMAGLKATYKSREESNLGKTGQILIEINTVNKPEQKLGSSIMLQTLLRIGSNTCYGM